MDVVKSSAFGGRKRHVVLLFCSVFFLACALAIEVEAAEESIEAESLLASELDAEIGSSAPEAPSQQVKQEAKLPSLQSLAGRVSIDVTAFQITGENPVSDEVSYAIVNEYLGPDKGIEDIENAAAALEQKLRDLGESFYRVSFPPQELSDGVIDLLVKRYKIGKIEVTGNNYYSDHNIVSSLPQLASGNSPSTKRIARSLTVANQNPGKRTRLTLASGEKDDEIDATLTVVDRKPLNISTWLNNTGTDASGEFRVGAKIGHRNLFGRDHIGSLSFITSPEDSSEVQQFSAIYQMPVYSLGGSFNFFAVNSNVDTGTVAEVFDVAGSGEVYGIGYAQILSKIGEYRQRLSLQATDKFFDNDITFQGEQLLSDVRSRPLALSYQANWKNNEGLELSGSISAVQNLSGGGNNTDSAYEDSRAGATQSWNKFELGANLQYTRGKWLYLGALKLSSTSDRLITGEQFALGGSNSIRGMEERELRGDQGYSLNFQAWAPPISKSLRPILFLDAGRAETNQQIEGELNSESVLSVGVMFNWNPSSRLTGSLSYGYLLDGIDFQIDPESSVSRDDDSKLHFNLSYQF